MLERKKKIKVTLSKKVKVKKKLKIELIVPRLKVEFFIGILKECLKAFFFNRSFTSWCEKGLLRHVHLKGSLVKKKRSYAFFPPREDCIQNLA